ncbi:thiol:disulfide interchange protein DsbG [Acidithiobacillus sp. AMEEHan]|uniref:thiol:disulfide interchange protein DsbG n=1 Tax=Acidithiobacillus sp. AMEEHan TaxID=2994951 RepID=UPI0027E5B931|nr:thiol:disulfide interchange protein DsbG [Acidithiobacillus sp. AMEEHan]
MRLRLLVLAAALSLAGCAGSSPVSENGGHGKVLSKDRAQELVSGVTHDQAQVTKVLPGPGGLTALVIADDGHKTLAYASPDGKYLILAQAIVNSKGENVIRHDAEEAGLLPKPLGAAQLAERASQAKSFVLGTKGPELIAFVDPNCIFCHKFYEDAKPLIAEGKLRVRYVVAAFLKPSSLGKAAAILSARDPAAAMAKNEKGFNEASEEGGISPDANPSPKVMAEVRKNTELLQDSGEVATPTIVYCDKDGKAQISHGMPEELDKFVSGITSMNAEGKCE